jgi:hypothetical protein
MTRFNAICIAALVLLGLASLIGAQEDDFTTLQGPYLGQKPPGAYPEIFAPGIISVDTNFEHSAAVFSPAGDEVVWCTNVGWYGERRQQGYLRLYFMKMVNGIWTSPRPVESTRHLRVERPVFSPEGNSLYIEFGSDPTVESNTDIYVMERTDDGWSAPKSVSPLINSSAWERLHCVTPEGSMYFTRNLLSSDEEILVSKLVDGEFTVPEALGESYNTDAPEYAIVIGPNEDYMLINQKGETPSSANVFISYKNADGTWRDRIKTPYYSGGFLALSPDGRYLFLMGEAIYWVSTSFVEDLKPEQAGSE